MGHKNTTPEPCICLVSPHRRHVEAVITNFQWLFYGGAPDRKRLDKLISRASSLSWAASFNPVEVVGDGRRGAKRSSMPQRDSKPMKDTLSAPESSFRDPKHVKE